MVVVIAILVEFFDSSCVYNFVTGLFVGYACDSSVGCKHYLVELVFDRVSVYHGFAGCL